MIVSPLAQVREAPTVTNYKQCIICQKKNSGTPLTKDPKIETLNTLLNKLHYRSHRGDISYILPWERLKKESGESLKDKNAIFHRSCYQKLTNIEHLERIESSFSFNEPEQEILENESEIMERRTRSCLPTFDKRLCFFCQNDVPSLRSDLHEICSENANEKLVRAINLSNNPELMVRLNSACDARAGDFKYHRKCWSKNVFKVLERTDKDLNEDPLNVSSASVLMELINAVKISISKSEILCMRDVHSVYSILMQEIGREDQRSERHQLRWLKQQLTEYIPGVSFEKSYKSNESSRLCFVGDRRIIMETTIRKLEDNKTDKETRILWKAAEIIRNEILNTRKEGDKDDLSAEPIPPKLQAFQKWLIAGRKDVHSVRNELISHRVDVLCKTTMYNVLSDRQTSYQPSNTESSHLIHRYENEQVVCLSLAVRQCGRRKGLVNLLHGMHICVSNDRCLQWETDLANDVIRNIVTNGGVYIPSGIKKGRFIQFHVDNVDFEEDTPDGKRTTHVLMMAAFQREFPEENEEPIKLARKQKSSSFKLVENNFNEILSCSKPKKTSILPSEGSRCFVIDSRINEFVKSNYKSRTLPWIIARSLEGAVIPKPIINLAENRHECIATNIHETSTIPIVQSLDEMSPHDSTIKLVVDDTGIDDTLSEHLCYKRSLGVEFMDVDLTSDEDEDKCDDSESDEDEDENQYLKMKSWCAYNSILLDSLDERLFRTKSFMFPLIPAPAPDPSSIYTALKRSQTISTWVMGHDTRTVISLDLDLYSRAYQLIQSRDDLRNKFILRLGELHIVFAHLRAIGTYIDSGIDDAWIEADVYGPCTVKQIINCSHMKRSIAAHEATLLVLYRLYFKSMSIRYPALFLGPSGSLYSTVSLLAEACDSKDENRIRELHEQLNNELENIKLLEVMNEFDMNMSENQQFRFLRVYMRMVERLFQFLHATRARDWDLHISAAEELCIDIGSMDRLKYRRLLPVYIADMKHLEVCDPAVSKSFAEGEFSVKKNDTPFTAIGVDHAGEQINKIMKIDGGLTGISNNENARNRYFLTVPVLANISKNILHRSSRTGTPTIHHQNTNAFQNRQSLFISKLESCLHEELTFIFTSAEPQCAYNMITKVYLPENFSAETIRCEEVGKELYDTFCKERLGSNPVKSIWDPISRVNVKLFKSYAKTKQQKCNEKIVEIKEHRNLFARCAIVSQSNRELDLKTTIGRYELSVVPRSLMNIDGSLLSTSSDKSKLAKHILEDQVANLASLSAAADAIAIIDAMVIVQSIDIKKLKLKTCKDIGNCFYNKILLLAEGFQQIRIVFDNYKERSLKSATRERRKGGEKTIKYKVSPKLDVSRYTIKKLLAHIETKKDFTKYLAKFCSERFLQQKRDFIISVDGISFGSSDFDVNHNHEEADTLMILHAVTASSIVPQPRIVVFSPDTDVLVLLVSHANKLSKECFIQLSYNEVKNIQLIREKLGEDKARALIGLHALTGCDSVGKFAGKTKSSWWKEFLHADPLILTALSEIGVNEVEDYIEHLVRFVCSVYCHKKTFNSLEDARWYLFCKFPDQCEKMPPTFGSFYQHVLRTHIQANIWWNADVAQQPELPIEMYGYIEEDGVMKPVTYDGDVAPSQVVDLIQCYCPKTHCKSNQCSCKKNKLVCTDLCQCHECDNIDIYVNSVDTDNNEDDDDD